MEDKIRLFFWIAVKYVYLSEGIPPIDQGGLGGNLISSVPTPKVQQPEFLVWLDQRIA